MTFLSLISGHDHLTYWLFISFQAMTYNHLTSWHLYFISGHDILTIWPTDLWSHFSPWSLTFWPLDLFISFQVMTFNLLTYNWPLYLIFHFRPWPLTFWPIDLFIWYFISVQDLWTFWPDLYLTTVPVLIAWLTELISFQPMTFNPLTHLPSSHFRLWPSYPPWHIPLQPLPVGQRAPPSGGHIPQASP